MSGFNSNSGIIPLLGYNLCMLIISPSIHIPQHELEERFGRHSG
jgi:hypothetical protein